MDEKMILNYPVLSSDSEIKELVIYIEEMEKSIQSKRKQLQNRVSILQSIACNHNFHKIMEFDKKYHWGVFSSLSGDEIMKGKECSECGLFETRPKGQPWDVCYKCGGEMKYKGKTPGQGGDGKHVYECKDCKHTVTHT